MKSDALFTCGMVFALLVFCAVKAPPFITALCVAGSYLIGYTHRHLK